MDWSPKKSGHFRSIATAKDRRWWLTISALETSLEERVEQRPNEVCYGGRRRAAAFNALCCNSSSTVVFNVQQGQPEDWTGILLG